MQYILSLFVLIVPTKHKDFFPTHVKAVQNMAIFDFADRYFKPVPILLIGLLPENYAGKSCLRQGSVVVPKLGTTTEPFICPV